MKVRSWITVAVTALGATFLPAAPAAAAQVCQPLTEEAWVCVTVDTPSGTVVRAWVVVGVGRNRVRVGGHIADGHLIDASRFCAYLDEDDVPFLTVCVLPLPWP